MSLRLRRFTACAALGAALLHALPAGAAPALTAARFTELASSKPNTLAAFHGKVTVVNFWATWCGPCREEMPLLDSFARKLAPKGVRVVGIALDNKADVQPFLREVKIGYPVWLGDANTIDLMRAAGNASGGLPYTVVLDRNGKTVASLLGRLNEKMLEDTVARHL
jgi:thiol-disulfide isomerase/thioredoxin